MWFDWIGFTCWTGAEPKEVNREAGQQGQSMHGGDQQGQSDHWKATIRHLKVEGKDQAEELSRLATRIHGVTTPRPEWSSEPLDQWKLNINKHSSSSR